MRDDGVDRTKRSGPALILFAKAPRPGKVKTRLIPQLGAAGAASLARELIELTVELSFGHWPGPIVLEAWPDTRDPCFEALTERYPLPLAVQAPGDLGRKMHQALERFTARGVAAAVLGCDVPHCPGPVLRRAHQLLAKGCSVVGPATDGGFYLIGLQERQATLFQGVSWGGDAALAQTELRARRVGLRLERLPALRDIDSFEDLKAAVGQLESLNKWIDR